MVTQSPLFVIRRSRPGVNVSGVLPNAAFSMGTALKITSKDADTGENTFSLATGLADGFVTRDVRQSTGSTDAELVNMAMGLTAGDSGNEMPFTAGKSGTIEFADAIEVEGVDFILTSGTGLINGSTAADTKLSFYNGKFYVAQTNDIAQFRVVAQMTPYVAGNVRIYVEAIEGYKA